MVTFEDQSTAPRVSIVMLTMNQLPYTKLCMESLARWTPDLHELIIIDNGSSDETPEYLRSLAGEESSGRIVPIFNEKNRGFAGGCNQGMERATGDAVLLLNNDVIVTEDWLSGLMTCLTSTPKVGIVGPMTNYISGLQKVEEASYPDKGDGLLEYAARYRSEHAGVYHPTQRLVGFAMLIAREVMDRIGVLDESFGGCGSFEDDDYCLRAIKAGYDLLACGDVFIHHFGHVTLDDPDNDLDKIASSKTNHEIFLKKWGRNTVDEHGLTLHSPDSSMDA